MAGALMTAAARAAGVELFPVDSEHSAVFQCLAGGKREEVRRILLTASGGPFASRPREELERVTPAEALRHPTWRMGAKITVDSATLMNKGLEIIEAFWLFGLPLSRIEVVIHPQSIVHSMVEFVDGSVLAQLGVPDMGIPILYALTYPDRVASEAPTRARSSGAAGQGRRSGKVSAYRIGMAMSATPSWAIIEPSMYSTME